MAHFFSEEFKADGFFFEARLRTFVEAAGERVVEKLQAIEPDTLDATEWERVASAVWDLPFFALMYLERCVSNGADEERYKNIVMRIYKQTERIFASRIK